MKGRENGRSSIKSSSHLQSRELYRCRYHSHSEDYTVSHKGACANGNELLHTNSMEQSPSSEVDSRSASQEFPRLLRKPKFHYHVIIKDPPLAFILSQINPIHNLPPYFNKTDSNIILPSMPRSSEWCLPFRFSSQNIVSISNLSYPCYMVRLSYPP